MNSIDIHNLNKSFDKKNILDNLCLELKEGMTTAIVGSNGIGKSVFLNCLLNYMEYDSGEITLFGHSHNNHIYIRTVTAFVSVDHQGHLNKITPMEYFELVISIYDLPLNQTLDQMNLLARELNILKELDSSFDSLSFGTKKKVQLIGSILYNPKLLVCDEIFEGLDYEAVTWVKDYFNQRKEDGLSTLFTSHINEYTEAVADEIYRLKNGKLYLQQKASQS